MLLFSLLAHLCVTTLQTPLVHLLRTLYTIGLAGAFGSSITFVSLRAPENRMGEMIGMLGASGFVGMAIGPFFGDLLFAEAANVPGSGVYQMFLWAAAAIAVALVSACLATRSADKALAQSKKTGSLRELWQSFRRYHPGFILVVGIAMGIGLGMPGTFLRPFAEGKGISGLRDFFLMYAFVAFVARLCTRRLADVWGARPTILLGLTSLAISMWTYLAVTEAWTLILPAVFAGLGHALLFPATVAAASQAFPIEYRGTATTLILMMFDVGMLIGQPTIGWSIDTARELGWNGYVVAFNGLAALLIVVAVSLAAIPARQRWQDAGSKEILLGNE
jgi:MFS family permease